MVRSTCLLACLLLPTVAFAQTTTVQGPDGRPATVTTTQGPDGIFRTDIRPAPPGGVAQGIPQRDTQPATGTSVIRGRVVDAANGTPLRRATITLFSAAIRESRSASTDID